MPDDDLGPTPTPQAEEPERFPGGVDALDDEQKYGDIPDEPLSRDMHPADNPSTDEVPDEITVPDAAEDTNDEPSSDGASEPQKESPA